MRAYQVQYVSTITATTVDKPGDSAAARISAIATDGIDNWISASRMMPASIQPPK